jgi:hypothetical protein
MVGDAPEWPKLLLRIDSGRVWSHVPFCDHVEAYRSLAPAMVGLAYASVKY